MVWHDLPAQFYPCLEQKNSVLLECSKDDPLHYKSFLFVNPLQILQLDDPAQLDHFFTMLATYLNQGYYLAGFFSYECGLPLLHLPSHPLPSPLAWFGVYQQPISFDHQTGLLSGTLPDNKADAEPITHQIDNLYFDLDPASYSQKIARIHDYIRAGDIYQLNFTGHYHFSFSGSPISLYHTLRRKQSVPYSAFIQTANQHILSFSPELFFSIDQNIITTRPMKGTVKRGRTPDEDQQQADWLAHDIKNRAENVMITDLFRNDLGRVAKIGSVNVPDLFTIERYDTLFQMTSTIQAKLKTDLSYQQLFQSIFPSGSITGAPKLRAMELIEELEQSPRGVYTGSIGYFAPPSQHEKIGKSVFNVAIRTVVLEQKKGVMGIGSGITYDSIASTEYAECELKADFLTSSTLNFTLIEAILWQDGYHDLDLHVSRIASSANYFSYTFPEEEIRFRLNELEKTLHRQSQYKVRLTLSQSGELTLEASILATTSGTKKLQVTLSNQPTNSENRFLFHKTSERSLYDRATRFALQHGYADVLFLNEKGQLTEGAISNIFLQLDGKFVTPSIDCGLLNGIYRQNLLKNQPDAYESVLTLEDLYKAEKIYLCNSIRGLREVHLVSDDSRFN